MMDDVEPLFVGLGRAPAQSPLRGHQAGARPGLPARDRLRPAHAASQPGASFAADVLLRAPGGRPPQPRLGRAGGDDRRVARGLAALPRALVLAAVAGDPARGRGQQRHALALARARRLPAEPRLRRAHRADLEAGNFDVDAFDADVRAGHMVGTNGPVLDVTIEDGGHDLSPECRSQPITVARHGERSSSRSRPRRGFRSREIRVIVNGKVVSPVRHRRASTRRKTLTSRAVVGTFTHRTHPAVDAGDCPRPGDAWLIVEAGLHQDDPCPTPTTTACPISPDADVPTRPRAPATRASIWRRSRPASGRPRSRTRSCSTSTAAAGRRPELPP